VIAVAARFVRAARARARASPPFLGQHLAPRSVRVLNQFSRLSSSATLCDRAPTASAERRRLPIGVGFSTTLHWTRRRASRRIQWWFFKKGFGASGFRLPGRSVLAADVEVEVRAFR